MRQFGKYRLIARLASGGIADVFRAEVPGAAGFVKEVALKLIRGDHRGRADFIAMFVHEARYASKLNHANIVQVFDFDEIDGRHYIAMEYVHGRHLRQVADRTRHMALRFSIPRAVHICAEVAGALGHAHRLTENGQPLGLVHRDVSPQNILISCEGQVKLTDFGIARAMNATGLTLPGTIKGKAAYMAPEQARGEPVDARADLFALGVVLWELVCGRPLFVRESDAATLAAVIGTQPIMPAREWNELVPEDLNEVIMSALERDREKRIGSAEEMAKRLNAALFKMVKSPDEYDLRAYMLRLWPEGFAAGSELTVERRVQPLDAPDMEEMPTRSRVGTARPDTGTTARTRRARRSLGIMLGAEARQCATWGTCRCC